MFTVTIARVKGDAREAVTASSSEAAARRSSCGCLNIAEERFRCCAWRR